MTNQAPIDALPLGEMKARHREEHLCLKCDHHLVCGMAKALDPNLLVTISSCLGFQPAEARPGGEACRLTTVVPAAAKAPDGWHPRERVWYAHRQPCSGVFPLAAVRGRMIRAERPRPLT